MDQEFNRRLAVIATEGRQKKKEAEAKQESLFEEDIYSNPPPLSQTLLGQADSTAGSSDKEYASGSFGPGQVAITGISIVAIAAFVATSVDSDLVAFAPRKSAPQAAAPSLSPAELKKRQEDAARFEAALSEKPDDAEALEGLAVTYAEMGEYSKAIPKLRALAATRPDDADVLRLLGETELASDSPKDAAEAYKQADAKSSTAQFDILKGLTSSLVASKQPAQAVEELSAARDALARGEREADYQQIEVDLLTGKVYTQWSGHNSDALKVYDTVIKEHPEDFRGFLAKGALLKKAGQKGDAERMFIQAKYLAPESALEIVRRVAGE